MKRYSSKMRMAIIAIAGLTVGLSVSNIEAAQDPTPTASPPPVSAATAPGAAALPYGTTEVVKMYQSGISKDVIINYINNTALPYHVGPNGIAYLQSLGMPQVIINTMVQRDNQLQQLAAQRPLSDQQVPPPAAVVTPQDQVVIPTAPVPDVTVIGPDYPYYYGGYPYYGYDYWPPVVVGGWWGGGWGHGWDHGGWGHGGRGGWGPGPVGGFHGGYGGGFHGGFHGGGGRR